MYIVLDYLYGFGLGESEFGSLQYGSETIVNWMGLEERRTTMYLSAISHVPSFELRKGLANVTGTGRHAAQVENDHATSRED